MLNRLSILTAVACLAIATPSRADVPSDVGMDPAEVKNIRALADKLVKAGFPNTEGAEFWIGEVAVKSQVDPEKETPAFPVGRSSIQATIPGSKEMEYIYPFGGLHATRRGGWMLSLGSRFKPDDKNTIATNKAEKLDLATCYAEAAENPYDLAKEAAGWVEGYPAEEKEQICHVINASVPLLRKLTLNPDGAPYAIVALHRAGLEEAPLLASVVADQRSRSFWQLRYWFEDQAPFDPSDVYPTMAEMEEAWHEEQDGTYVSEPADVAFRRAFHRVVRQALLSGGELFSDETAARLSKATLDPGDPQGIGRSIDLLLAGRKISEDVADDADLKTKLSAWGRPKEPEMVVRQGEGDEGGLTMSTAFLVPEPAYSPAGGDLKGLFALVSDRSASKWSDFQGGRDVGENAMRALSVIFGRNVFELVEMDKPEPWTEERRKMVEKKLQQWWRHHEADYQKFVVGEE